MKKIDKVYLFETDELWIEALKKTFEPFKEKICILNKCVSDVTANENITLADFFIDLKLDFIKS